MDRFQRLYQLLRLLDNRRTPIPIRQLVDNLECSERTVKRAIEDARTILHAPVVYDREHNGYQLAVRTSESRELPGLWFNSSELYALLVCDQLLRKIRPSILAKYIAPLRDRINELMNVTHCNPQTEMEIARRVRILQSTPREIELEQFRRIVTALLERRRIRVFYHGRARDATTERVISPQRLIYYRDNWYLDGWCHLRRALRSFSIERLHVVETKDDAAKDLDEPILDEHYAASYGIFSGHPRHRAVLRFSPAASRWVADEQWHPEQESRVLPDGSTELTLPYSDSRELIMDILRFGPEVRVMAPRSLKTAIMGKLHEALGNYHISPRDK